jgi:surface antigen
MYSSARTGRFFNFLLTSLLFVLAFFSFVFNGYGKYRFPAGYCTWYAADKFDSEVPRPGLDWGGNAGKWYENARVNGWATSNKRSVAEKGAIIVWTNQDSKGRDSFGHVAFVESVSSNSITISEMNWGLGATETNPKTVNFGKITTATLPLSNLDRGNSTKYYFEGFIFPRKSNDQCFTGEFGGTDVEYIKREKPGGYNWNILFPMVNAPQTSSIQNAAEWSYPRQIWYEFQTASKGCVPKVNSVMVIDGSGFGHVAIVTGVEGDKILVRHSNWMCENRQLVTTGYFRLVEGGQKVTYNDGLETFRLTGFIYKPWGNDGSVRISVQKTIQKNAQSSQAPVNITAVKEKNVWDNIVDFFRQFSFSGK